MGNRSPNQSQKTYPKSSSFQNHQKLTATAAVCHCHWCCTTVFEVWLFRLGIREKYYPNDPTNKAKAKTDGETSIAPTNETTDGTMIKCCAKWQSSCWLTRTVKTKLSDFFRDQLYERSRRSMFAKIDLFFIFTTRTMVRCNLFSICSII